jgi:hypothetical protein
MKKLFLLIKRMMMRLLYLKWLRRLREVAGLQRVGDASRLFELVFTRRVRMGLILVTVMVTWLRVRRAVLMLVTMGIMVVLILMNLILLVLMLMTLLLLMLMIIAAVLLLLRTLVIVLLVLMVMALVLPVVSRGAVVPLVLMVMAVVLLVLMVMAMILLVLMERTVVLPVHMVRVIKARILVRIAMPLARQPLTIRMDKQAVEVISIFGMRDRKNGFWNRRGGGRSWIEVSLHVIPHPSVRSRRWGRRSNRGIIPLVTLIRTWWRGKRLTRKGKVGRRQRVAPPALGWGVCHQRCR